MKRTVIDWTAALLLVAAFLSAVVIAPMPVAAQGATQIAGLGEAAQPGECTDGEGAGADFVLKLTGDLTGCHYVFVDSSACSPSGTFRERGREIFVGTYDGQAGTFKTTYHFTAKYEDCPTFTVEIFGRCQHPLVANTGTGVFEGATGRLDFKDDIEAGNFPYRGHLRW